MGKFVVFFIEYSYILYVKKKDEEYVKVGNILGREFSEKGKVN